MTSAPAHGFSVSGGFFFWNQAVYRTSPYAPAHCHILRFSRHSIPKGIWKSRPGTACSGNFSCGKNCQVLDFQAWHRHAESWKSKTRETLAISSPKPADFHVGNLGMPVLARLSKPESLDIARFLSDFCPLRAKNAEKGENRIITAVPNLPLTRQI